MYTCMKSYTLITVYANIYTLDKVYLFNVTNNFWHGNDKDNKFPYKNNYPKTCISVYDFVHLHKSFMF